MSNSTPIETLTGQQRPRSGEARFTIQAYQSGDLPYIGILAKANGPVKMIGRSEMLQGVQGWEVKAGGALFKSNYEVAEGTILKLSGMRRASLRIPDMASLWVRVRAAAPLTEVKAKLTHDAMCPIRFGHVRGRFDILSGLELSSLVSNVQFTDASPEAVARIFTIEELAPALAQPTVKVKEIETSTGERVVVNTLRRTRIIRR